METRQPNRTIVKDALSSQFKIIARRYEQQEPTMGVPTGYYMLDKATAGFHRGELVLIHGDTTVGASLLLQNMLTRVAVEYSIPVLFLSPEMLCGPVVERLAAIEGKIAPAAMHNGTLTPEQWMELTRAAGRLAESPIWIDDSPSPSLAEITAWCRSFHEDKEVFAEADQMGMIAVDGLELIRPPEGLIAPESLREVIRGLKAVAMEIRLPVVVVSRQPTSVVDGQLGLGADADTVLEFEKTGERERHLNVVKRRMGVTSHNSIRLKRSGFRFNDVISADE